MKSVFNVFRRVLLVILLYTFCSGVEPLEFSGIYPHLAMFNNEDECGTGAVVPWADKLWVITYGPHKPNGSTDKLYEITADLEQIVREESIGGTPANRMIHPESQQLFIGPYVIDSEGDVRVIPYSTMFGRLTGNARHLSDPENRIYYATMEEGIYDVDVHLLEVSTLYFDEAADGKPKADLPGYHGKGLYSGQGKLIYANNGEHGDEALHNPFVASGVLAEWDGRNWTVVERHQFTEVTGPGGIYGNADPANDPVWSIGWDAKSLILEVLHEGQWQRYRLPKASHSYDGAHGWNTEWPRIRDIGKGNELLMTMHGAFWRFPKTFNPGSTAGIAPRSSYLKVIGDFCRWNDRLVFGCDDTARNEFLNKRKAKGDIAAPQSQSNLWFVEEPKLDTLGPVLARGAVWLNEDIETGPSDPYLVNGFGRLALHLSQEGDTPVNIRVEIDREGSGAWKGWKTLELSPKAYQWVALEGIKGADWVRLVTEASVPGATAWFTGATPDLRSAGTSVDKFRGLAHPLDRHAVGGIVLARSGNQRTLSFAAMDSEGISGLYTLDASMRLTRNNDEAERDWVLSHAAIPDRTGVLQLDSASVLYIDDNGKRYRLPRSGNVALDEPGALGIGRLVREVATERDLFNCHGTFYELPAENAGGFSRIRPVSTHGLRLTDYCSYRGLFVISGVNLDHGSDNRHLIKSDDGKAALWVGAIDDIWEMGKPVGTGGPWKNSEVKAGQASDPFLMFGYDEKNLIIEANRATRIAMEIDISGMGDWRLCKTFDLTAGNKLDYTFPEQFQAYWVRFISHSDATVTAQFKYK